MQLEMQNEYLPHPTKRINARVVLTIAINGASLCVEGGGFRVCRSVGIKAFSFACIQLPPAWALKHHPKSS